MGSLFKIITTGRRPVLVLSLEKYNIRSGLALVCPLTSKSKNYPYEVRLSKGAILTDQIRSISWKERNCKYISRVPPNVLLDVLNKIKILLDI